VKSKVSIILLISLGLILACLQKQENVPAPIWFQKITLEEALKKAEAEKKPVFVDVFTTWCGPCKLLDSITFQDSKVSQLLIDKTIPIKVDGEVHRDFIENFKIEGFPTLLLLNPDGTMKARFVGYVDAARLVELLNPHLN
jgi:thiol:disulfide interchange protein